MFKMYRPFTIQIFWLIFQGISLNDIAHIVPNVGIILDFSAVVFAAQFVYFKIKPISRDSNTS